MNLKNYKWHLRQSKRKVRRHRTKILFSLLGLGAIAALVFLL